MEKLKFEGKTKEEAVTLALYEMNLKEEDLIYTAKEEKLGLLKGKKYILECVSLKDVSIYCKNILEKILSSFDLKANIETKIRDREIYIDIFSDNNSLIIGKQGRVLESLSNYLKQLVSSETNEFIRIHLDIEKYREKQLYYLERDVKNIAREVKETKMEVKLDPMSAYERKIVHDIISKTFKYITTESVGEEPNRCIVIKYQEEK